MRYYEQIYLLRNNEKVVQRKLNDFFLFQIYSPLVIRQAYCSWPDFPWYLKENTPKEIKDLMEQSPYLSNKKLKQSLDEWYVQNAVKVLTAYQSCNVPITRDKTIAQNCFYLISEKGDAALEKLNEAVKKNNYSDEIVELAVRTGHKFLADDKYYINFKISSQMASDFAIPTHKKGQTETDYVFPAIQLTRGCMNQCSHCDSRAQPHLAHMPWPVFKNLYRNFNKYYHAYRQVESGHYFSNFFADSDILDYRDPIMGVDSGDVGLWITKEDGFCNYLTRGVKNESDKLALAKALVSGQPVGLSFVDTPLENMTRNLQQLHETLDVVKSVRERCGNPFIIHVHPKSGPSVDKSVVHHFQVESKVIHAVGRAKNFPESEVNSYPDTEWLPRFIIDPSGDVTLQNVKNGEICREKLNNIFKKQLGPQIDSTRLFWRQGITRFF